MPATKIVPIRKMKKNKIRKIKKGPKEQPKAAVKVKPLSDFKIDFSEFGPKAKKLPRTLSGWIRVAVEDAKRLSKRKNFELDMGVYNNFEEDDEGNETGVCHVCLGGAAIVGRGLVPPGEDTNGDATSDVAYSLDMVRRGNIYSAIRFLYGDEFNMNSDGSDRFDDDHKVMKTIDEVTEKLRKEFYSSNYDRPSWRSLLRAANKLAKIGL